MVLVFVLALIAGGLAGLPADYVRRSHPGSVATVAGVANAAVLVAAVAALTATGLVSGAAAVAAMVLGVVAGNVAADALATALWGPAGNQS